VIVDRAREENMTGTSKCSRAHLISSPLCPASNIIQSTGVVAHEVLLAILLVRVSPFCAVAICRQQCNATLQRSLAHRVSRFLPALSKPICCTRRLLRCSITHSHRLWFITNYPTYIETWCSAKMGSTGDHLQGRDMGH
jgi:hypothetical protein